MSLPTPSAARERVRAAVASGNQDAMLATQQQVDLWLQIAGSPKANASPELIRALRELADELARHMQGSRDR